MNEIQEPQYKVIIYDKKVKDAFLQVSDEKTYLKEIIFAKQAFDNSDNLQKCTTESIRNAIVNIALTGATLNPALQQAWLIPRKGKANLDFGYRGLIQIAISSGGVLDMDATVVYDNDEFYFEMGLNPALKHIPFDGDRGQMKYVYAIAILPSGIKKFIVLDKKEIESVKKSSMAFTKGSDSPWKGDFEAEMWRKTAVKKLYKMCPQTERMSTATTILNEHEGLAKLPTTSDKLQERFTEKQDEPEQSSEYPEFDKKGTKKDTSEVEKAPTIDPGEPKAENQSQGESQPEKPPFEEIVAKITDVKKKEGKGKDEKPYTRFEVWIDKEMYSTFSESAAKIAKVAKESDKQVKIYYEMSGKYKNLKEIIIVEE